MNDPISHLASLSRPRLLVRAAKHGMTEFNRSRSLRRIMPGEATPAPGKAFEILLAREDDMNTARREGTAGYSPARHIELLAALIHEARIADCRMVG